MAKITSQHVNAGFVTVFDLQIISLEEIHKFVEFEQDVLITTA